MQATQYTAMHLKWNFITFIYIYKIIYINGYNKITYYAVTGEY